MICPSCGADTLNEEVCPTCETRMVVCSRCGFKTTLYEYNAWRHIEEDKKGPKKSSAAKTYEKILSLMRWLRSLLSKKSNATLSLDFPKITYSPGDQIKGDVTLKSNENLEVQQAEVRLNCKKIVDLSSMSPMSYEEGAPSFWIENLCDEKRNLDIGLHVFKGEAKRSDFAIEIPADKLNKDTLPGGTYCNLDVKIAVKSRRTLKQHSSIDLYTPEEEEEK